MHPRKILVIKFRALGDTALMSAPIRALAHEFPSAEIHVAVTARWAPLVENLPSVTKIWPYSRREEHSSRAKAIASLGLKLRRERYDWVINLHASPSSALLAFATGARTRAIHFHGLKDRNRYSTVDIPGKGVVKPAIERDMDTLRALDIDIPEGLLPRIALTPDENEWSRNWMDEHAPQDPILGLGLGASRLTKIWPLDRFAEVAAGWIEKTQGSVVVFTGPGEEGLLQSFRLACQGKIPEDKAARLISPQGLTIRQLAALLQQCRVYCGNDSGPKHLAVSVGTPTVTLMGPEHPLEWHPYPTALHPFFFVEDLACRKDGAPGSPPWCGLEVCSVEAHQCMMRIPSQSVLETCLKIGV